MSPYRYLLVFLTVLFLTPFFAFAQQDSTQIIDNQSDSVVIITESAKEVTQVYTTDSVLRKKHSPKLAIGLSIVLPGAGQVYNRKWWKVPIVYGCLGASSYCIYHFGSQMKRYKMEYRNRMQGNLNLLDPTLAKYGDDNILEEKQKNQQFMEISIAATAILYVLNVIDAAVDAHLFYFDISDDLSLHWSPYVAPTYQLQPSSAGVSFAFKLK